MSWQEHWDGMPAGDQDRLKRAARRYFGVVPGVGTDGSVPTEAALQEVLEYQQLEDAVLTAHEAWLRRTRRAFEARGIPWTAGELARRSRLWVVGE